METAKKKSGVSRSLVSGKNLETAFRESVKRERGPLERA